MYEYHHWAVPLAVGPAHDPLLSLASSPRLRPTSLPALRVLAASARACTGQADGLAQAQVQCAACEYSSLDLDVHEGAFENTKQLNAAGGGKLTSVMDGHIEDGVHKAGLRRPSHELADLLGLESFSVRHGQLVVSVASCIGGRAVMEDQHAVSVLHITPHALHADTGSHPFGVTSPASSTVSTPGHSFWLGSAAAAHAHSSVGTTRPAKLARVEGGPRSCPTAVSMPTAPSHTSANRHVQDEVHSGADGVSAGYAPGRNTVLCAGVFDGHSGAEVARYAAQHLPALLARTVADLCTNDVRGSGGGSTPGPQAAHSPGTAHSADAHAQVRGELPSTVPVHIKEEACRRAFMQLDCQLADPSNARELYGLSHGNHARGEEPPAHYGWWGDDADGSYIGPSAGSTAVVALLDASSITVAFVGDSRALYSESCDSGVRQLTHDHKPLVDEMEECRVVAAGGWLSRSGRVNSELDMSRCLGDMEFKQARDLAPEKQAVIALPDVMSVQLPAQHDDSAAHAPFQYLLLCSDGLSNALTNEEVHDLASSRLSQGTSPEDVCKELCVAACVSEYVAYDNVTAMLIIPSAPQA